MSGEVNFPAIGAPMVDPKTGTLTASGHNLLLALWTRTGSGPGFDLATATKRATNALQADAGLSDLKDIDTGRDSLSLGTAAVHRAEDFASADGTVLKGSAPGWSLPVGTVARAGLDGGWAPISTPTGVVGLEEQELLLTRVLSGLVKDLLMAGPLTT